MDIENLNFKKDNNENVNKNEALKSMTEYLEKEAKQMSEFLPTLLDKHKVILVGENHTKDNSIQLVRKKIMETLDKLKENGLTHIALELPTSFQEKIDSIEFKNRDIKDIVSDLKPYKPIGWSAEHIALLIKAKQIGLKTLFVDKDLSESYVNSIGNARIENARDEHMTQVITNEMVKLPDSKFLVFIGNNHIHKKEVQVYEDGSVKRLGARLHEKIGKEVTSIRFMGPSYTFDGLSAISSQPRLEDIIENTNIEKDQVFIVPDDGPLKGDPRVTASDYVIFSTTKDLI